MQSMRPAPRSKHKAEDRINSPSKLFRVLTPRWLPSPGRALVYAFCEARWSLEFRVAPPRRQARPPRLWSRTGSFQCELSPLPPVSRALLERDYWTEVQEQ